MEALDNLSFHSMTYINYKNKNHSFTQDEAISQSNYIKRQQYSLAFPLSAHSIHKALLMHPIVTTKTSIDSAIQGLEPHLTLQLLAHQ
jgi:hypothetical protein